MDPKYNRGIKSESQDNTIDYKKGVELDIETIDSIRINKIEVDTGFNIECFPGLSV